jgi:hypothetical protein
MLTEREVIPYLLQKQFISAAALVDGDLAVIDASRRNCTFHVVRAHGPGYVLKQGVDPASRATVAREAAIYQYLQTQSPSVGLARYLPRYYGYDPHEHVLILELVRAAHSLHEAHVRRGRFPMGLAAAMGQALGALHDLPGTPDNRTLQEGATLPAWVLGLHRPGLGLFRTVSGANLQLIKIVQSSPELCQYLEELQQAWRADALIHADIKWDNWLAWVDPATPRTTRVKLVDWEFAALGDPCWDVGAVFTDYLSVWLFSIPITGETPPEHFLELARYPLAQMHPAIRAFWQAYVQRRALAVPTAQYTLLRAVQYGAARLLHKAFEQLQASLQLLGTTVCMSSSA